MKPHIDDWHREIPYEVVFADVIDAKKNFFWNKLIMHPKLKDASTKIQFLLRNPIPGLIIVVIGPTGAGKTTLCKGIVRWGWREYGGKPGIIPIAGTTLYSPSDQKFKWKKPHQHGLSALREPLIDEKVSYEFVEKNGHKNLKVKTRHSTDDLQDILISALGYRGTIAYYMDEANHLLTIGNYDSYLQVMDYIKNFAERAKIPIILYGTYATADLLEQSAQLDRRTVLIHLPRYDIKNEEDAASFYKAVADFSKLIPTKDETDLLPYWDYLYEATFGCIGILKEWLYISVCAALEDTTTTSLTLKHLSTFRASNKRLLERATKILAAEARFVEVQSTDKLRELIGIDEAMIMLKKRMNGEIKKENIKTHKPFQRKPNNDPIGLDRKD